MYVCMYVCMYVYPPKGGCMYVCNMVIITYYSKSKDKVANPAGGQLNGENEYFPVPVRA